MTLIKPITTDLDEDESLATAEQLFEEAGILLGRLLSQARMEEDDDAAKLLKPAVKNYSEGQKIASAERMRVANERKTRAGIVGSYAIDMGAARVEIERRMARLRAAGNG